MATSSPDSEQLISQFCGPLAPADRAAFRAAAESALRAVDCGGEGLAYRTLRDVWRGYFHPPADEELAHSGPRHRGGKLVNGPPLDEDSARGRAASRSRWMRGWRG